MQKLTSFARHQFKAIWKGTEERNLRELARELGIENCIQFMGEISNVEDELRHGRCFVLSSDFEGMPNALMEQWQLECRLFQQIAHVEVLERWLNRSKMVCWFLVEMPTSLLMQL